MLYPLVIKEHATHARTEARKAALERFVTRFLDVDPSLEPVKPDIPPGLCTVVVQFGDVIPLDLMTNLLTPTKGIKNLYEAERLAMKVFRAWGAL